MFYSNFEEKKSLLFMDNIYFMENSEPTSRTQYIYIQNWKSVQRQTEQFNMLDNHSISYNRHDH